MRCEELRDLLHGYADGELDLVRSLEIEQHLQGCPACADALRGLQALRTALSDSALYHRPSARLRERVRSSLRRAGRPRRALPALSWRPLAVAASLAFVALLAWGAVRLLSPPSHEDLVAQDVVSGYVRSLMDSHPPGVKSSDQHTVKPWLTRRLEFALDVKDLAGYPLVGGQVEYLDNKKVAALVYERGQHRVDLFIWPVEPGAESIPREMTRQGYHLVHWTSGGLTYWAISDLNANDLREFVRLLQR